jgi:diacylglycerol O-acyltransferase / wax synthase
VAERLSAADMSSLLAERGPIHVHVGATIIVEGEPPEFRELLRHVNKRLHLVPRFRQKVTQTPLKLTNPSWEDDSGFDVRWHVRHVALPPPGNDQQLRELVGQIMSEPLDMSRPLWQLYLIEGLKGDRHAYVSKTHHALVDGVSAVDVGTIMLDPTPEGTALPKPGKRWEPDEPSGEMLFVRAASDRVAGPLRTAAKAARSAVTMPRSTANNVRRTAEGFAGLAAGGPTAPKTPLNVPIGPDRRVSFVKTKPDRLRRARKGSATVNDVILAVTAGALRHFFAERGDKVPKRIVALVPVSIRRADEKGELGNRISTILVPLPLDTASPTKRLREIAKQTKKLKESEQVRAASLLIQATGWAPPTINRVLSAAMARPLVFNLVVSNVPGPQMPFYLLGRKVREIYPFVPLSPQNHALSVGIVSYDGDVFFGLVGDREIVGDLHLLAKALRKSLREQAPANRKSSPAPR